jgi:inorganic pyrophosphatase/exopolyphosphatase
MYFEDTFDPDHSKVVMVDHSAPSQMHPSFKKLLIDDGCTDILQGAIIDHHALDENIYTKAPLCMNVRPWGSISTSIPHSFSRSALTIPVDVARLLLCAIMSDSMNLTSPTTTFQKKINSTLRWIIPVGQTLFIFCYC